MSVKIGIDVGGTFTDFIVARDGEAPLIHKVLSTPADPSIAVVDGLAEIAAMQTPAQSPSAFIAGVDTIVHGTTVTTNATLTRTGAKCGLVTTRGVRDALGQGLLRASTMEDFTGKAWAMRDAFDGLLDVISRKLEPGGAAGGA
jgi:N-methylhydantoinase A/oxoprolinase/acetone carboxylase beta subunit